MSQIFNPKASEVTEADFAIIEAEERFVYEVQKTIRRLMKDRDIKAKDLSDLLDVSEARISQMMGPQARNLTLRTVAKIFHVLGKRAELQAAIDDALEPTVDRNASSEVHIDLSEDVCLEEGHFDAAIEWAGEELAAGSRGDREDEDKLVWMSSNIIFPDFAAGRKIRRGHVEKPIEAFASPPRMLVNA